MSLTNFFQILWARRAIVLAALLSCVAAALVTVQLLPERYTGRARLMLDLVKPDPVTGQVVGSQFLRAYMRTQIELIKDYQIGEPVVERLGWMSNPTIIESYQNSEAAGTEDMRHWLARTIIQNTDATLIEGSNILEITYKSSDPEVARRVAELIRDTYIDTSLQSRRENAARTADWYQQQAQQVQAAVTTAETERAKFAKANGIVLNAQNTDLESARLDALSGQSAAMVGVTAATPARAPAQMGQAQMQLEALNQQIAQAASIIGPNHPSFQAMQRQRALLESAAARERAAGGAAAGSPGGVNAGAVNAAYERQKARVIARTPEIERVQAMTRDIEQKRGQLSRIQERVAESRLSANVSETGMTSMGVATAGEKPDFPNKPLILSAATVFGLVIGICLALLVELLGRRVRNVHDLEMSSGAPVLAEIRFEEKDAPRRWLPGLRGGRPALPAPEAA